jgi:hypothetical protein
MVSWQPMVLSIWPLAALAFQGADVQTCSALISVLTKECLGHLQQDDLKKFQYSDFSLWKCSLSRRTSLSDFSVKKSLL